MDESILRLIEGIKIMMKFCRKCEEYKHEDEFKINKKTNKLENKCKVCEKIRRKVYYNKNREKICKRERDYNKTHKKEISERWAKYYKTHKEELKQRQKTEKRKKYMKEYNKKYYQENKEREKERARKDREQNKDRVNKTKRRCEKQRRKEDACYRLRCNVSSLIRVFFKKQKKIKENSILKYLPYTMEELKQHLEKQFEDWMNWGNYGKYEKDKKKWNIDHIIPQSLLPYDSMEHPNFLKCWALENLRPLEIIENFKKGNKLIK